MFTQIEPNTLQKVYFAEAEVIKVDLTLKMVILWKGDWSGLPPEVPSTLGYPETVCVISHYQEALLRPCG